MLVNVMVAVVVVVDVVHTSGSVFKRSALQATVELRYLVRSGCQLQGRESRTELTEDVSRVQPYYRAERARPVGVYRGLRRW